MVYTNRNIFETGQHFWSYYEGKNFHDWAYRSAIRGFGAGQTDDVEYYAVFVDGMASHGERTAVLIGLLWRFILFRPMGRTVSRTSRMPECI